ncbi:hypothetical protein H6P81_016683 [Aristolochia fimbriata]|uniref:Uncharacterized protein n=1 Tax=Aristolochia fimbriata TaxID=158543 RepID=A0AAV7E949_ARIFI|nr:hypothetical protein H6P81_016683 [Aristolochia fimbriata]
MEEEDRLTETQSPRGCASCAFASWLVPCARFADTALNSRPIALICSYGRIKKTATTGEQKIQKSVTTTLLRGNYTNSTKATLTKKDFPRNSPECYNNLSQRQLTEHCTEREAESSSLRKATHECSRCCVLVFFVRSNCRTLSAPCMTVVERSQILLVDLWY